MDDVASWADYALVLNQGQLVAQGTPREIFYSPQSRYELSKAGLGLPFAVSFAQKLSDRGISLPIQPLTNAELHQSLLDAGFSRTPAKKNPASTVAAAKYPKETSWH